MASSAPSSSSSSATADIDDLRRDLELYRRYPTAMALIEKESAVYLEHRKDDPTGTLISPIVASHRYNLESDSSSESEKERSQDDQVARKMAQLTLLAALHASDDDPMRIFLVRDQPFALYPSLKRFFAEDSKRPKAEGGNERVPLRDAVSYLEECLDLAEYVQLPKALCARMQVAIAGEKFRLKANKSRTLVPWANESLGPVLVKAREELQHRAVRAIGEEASKSIRFEEVFGYRNFVEGACNVAITALPGGYNIPFSDSVAETTIYHIGRVVGGHPLVEADLRCLKQNADMIGFQLKTRVPVQEMDVAALSGNIGGVKQLIAAGFPVPSFFQ